MKSDVETLTPTRVRLTVEVPFEELKPSLDAAYKTIGSQVSIPGFRKGKVPTSLIDQRFGRGVVLDEAVNAYLPDAYGAAVREHEVRVLGQPDIDVTEFADGADLKFTAEVDCRPEITLPDFDGLEVEVAEVVVADADVDEQVEALRTRFATLTTVERAAATGDFLTLDLTASRDGEAIEDATAAGLSYEVGTEALLDGLDAVVAGLSAGETGTFESELNDGEETPADISVTVTAVRERELPALDDDFAQLASEFDTLEELRDDLRSRLTRVRRLQQGAEARDALLDKLLSLVDVPLPGGARRRRGRVALRRRSRRRRAPRAVHRGHAQEPHRAVRPRRDRREGGARARGGRALRIPHPSGTALRHDARRLRAGPGRGRPGPRDHGRGRTRQGAREGPRVGNRGRHRWCGGRPRRPRRHLSHP